MDSPSTPNNRHWSRSSFGSDTDAMTVCTTVSVRNSLGSGNGILEEEELSEVDQDVEDEVFVREPNRRGFSLLSSVGDFKNRDPALVKPLMAPRKKLHVDNNSVVLRRGMLCRTLCPFISYLILAFLLFLGLIGLVVFIVNYVMVAIPLPRIMTSSWKSQAPSCEQVSSAEDWVQKMEGVQVTAFANFKITDDLVSDVVLAFSTGLAGLSGAQLACDAFFSRYIEQDTVKEYGRSCVGGLRAIDGASGKVVWNTWVDQVIDGIDCSEDLDHDGTLDCLIWGLRGADLVSGKTGRKLWTFAPQLFPLEETTSTEPGNNSASFHGFMTGDINGDQIADVIVTLLFDCTFLQSTDISFIWALNGKSGELLLPTDGPKNEIRGIELEPICQKPGVIMSSDGSNQLLIITQNGVKLCPLASAYFMQDCAVGSDLKKARGASVADFPAKVALSPRFVDLTNDGMDDVILCLQNATIALNLNSAEGKSVIWIHRANPNVDDCADIAVGQYDSDSVPDVAVRYVIHGPNSLGFSQLVIINGKDGTEMESRIVGPEFRPRKSNRWRGSSGILTLSLQSVLSSNDELGRDVDLFMMPMSNDGTKDSQLNKNADADIGNWSSRSLAREYLEMHPEIQRKYVEGSSLLKPSEADPSEADAESDDSPAYESPADGLLAPNPDYFGVPSSMSYPRKHGARDKWGFNIAGGGSSKTWDRKKGPDVQRLVLRKPVYDDVSASRVPGHSKRNKARRNKDVSHYPGYLDRRKRSPSDDVVHIPVVSLGLISSDNGEKNAVDLIASFTWIPVAKYMLTAGKCLSQLLKDEAAGFPDLNICKQEGNETIPASAFSMDLPLTLVRKLRVECACKPISTTQAALNYILRTEADACPKFVKRQRWSGVFGSSNDGHFEALMVPTTNG
ncbi:unnamed protein product [Notodromas monacha]|uniref:Uncharacterized protein n=1 Tax=Notodromas monacha TaxID=399045 RepID=A0A7R9BLN4_9CRUS|nr:unnamed protein product [Notodromas monacha]CAG0916452.1 unnamed protein product [Notodromas monacha]